MTTTAVPEHAAGEHELLPETLSTRKIARLERFLGPENYRIVKGLLTTPASIAGLILLASFLSDCCVCTRARTHQSHAIRIRSPAMVSARTHNHLAQCGSATRRRCRSGIN